MRLVNRALFDRWVGGTGWLSRFARTSAFRLVLLYSGLFTVSVLILLGMMLWSGSAYVTRQTDQIVTDELDDVRAAAARPGSGGLRVVVADIARHAAPGSRYLLEDSAGTVLAGNMPAIPPVSGPMTWYPDGLLPRVWPLAAGVRGAGTHISNGDFLFVGRDTFALNEMRETITHSFLWVFGSTLFLAVCGGVLMSVGTLGRVEAIGRTSQEIIAGDLSRRVPVRGSGDEFDRLAVSLNSMLDRIQSLMEGMNQVSSDIAHDLRTPLTRLRQRLELARRAEAGAESMRASLDAATQDVDAILETFAALLRIAQIEARVQASEWTRLDLSATLEALVEFYTPFAEENGHALRGSIAPALFIEGDAELLTQAFANLIENAIRHSDAGAVTVTATRREPSVVVDVHDPGPGIPEEFHGKVFQRFFRLERSRTTPGTGLGLSLVAAVARMHRARLVFMEKQKEFHAEVQIPDGNTAHLLSSAVVQSVRPGRRGGTV